MEELLLSLLILLLLGKLHDGDSWRIQHPSCESSWSIWGNTASRDEWCPCLLLPRSCCWTSRLSDTRVSWDTSRVWPVSQMASTMIVLEISSGGFWHNYKKEYPGIYFEIDAQQTCSSLDNDISASSSEGIQILGMRCQPLIASKGSSDDLRWAPRRGWVMETWSQEIQQDHIKSWFGLRTSIPLQQMFAAGMAANSVSSIADNLALRDPAPAARTWRSLDVNSAGQWSALCRSDIMEQISQPCAEKRAIGKSTRWMSVYRSYHNGSTHCLTFSKLNLD